jgi:hypothetical protein
MIYTISCSNYELTLLNCEQFIDNSNIWIIFQHDNLDWLMLRMYLKLGFQIELGIVKIINLIE